MLGAGGLIALYAVACLLACVVIALSGALTAWLAALIVGVVLLAVSAAAALLGKGRLQRPPLSFLTRPSAASRPTSRRSSKGHTHDDSRTGRKAGGTAPARGSGI